MKISKAMNKAIVIDKDIKLRDAAKIMSNKNIGSLIIMKGEKIAGIVTERDVLKNIGKLDSKISSVMSRNIITINEGESINNAALTMDKHRIKRLPVVKRTKLVGIITVTDVLAHTEELGENFFFE